MSRWTCSELRQLRSRLKAALTHADSARCSAAVHTGALELLRVRLREDLASVERLLAAEQHAVNQEAR